MEKNINELNFRERITKLSFLYQFYMKFTDLYLELPRGNSIERISIGGRISENTGMGAAIISRGYCIEFFLSCSIPQHQSYILTVDSVSTNTYIYLSVIHYILYIITMWSTDNLREKKKLNLSLDFLQYLIIILL